MAQIRSLEAAWLPAVELYRQSLALEDDPATRLELANACISVERYDDGLAEINKVLAADPKSAEAWHVKGKIQMAKEDYRGSVDRSEERRVGNDRQCRAP